MKKLVLKELMILSFRERKAKRIKFNPKTTVIKGTNQVGKSSLIKSIYYTLGATPSIMHPNWIKSEPISMLKLKVNDENLTVLRYDKKNFIVVDDSDNLMSYNFKGFSEYLNEVLDFKLIINNRQGVAETPPPAYLFLPFYVDQDIGWIKNWDSFSNLSQFSKWKKPLLDYHSGIKGNAYYKAKSKFDKTSKELDDKTNEIEALNKILKNINKKLNEVDLSITVEDFSEEIKELIGDCEKLKIEQNKIKQKLTGLYDQKISLGSKISIVEKSIKELNKDYKYALDVLEDEIDCPTCGAHYENNFAERFSIADDQETLEDLYDELRIEYMSIIEKIRKFNEEFIDRKTDYEKIQEVLNKKQSEVKLSDIIENEGKRKVKEIFKQEQTQIHLQIGKAKSEKDRLEKKLKDIDKKGKIRKDNIMSMYRVFLRKYLLELNIDVNKFSEQVFKRMDSPIKETGSALPRALLAYYFTFLNVMNKYSTSTFCPIIIDSPKQQDPDEENVKAIINFIEKNKPDNSQLILGYVDNKSSTFDLKEKYHLLQSDVYDEVYEEMKPLLEGGVFGNQILFF